MHMRREQCPARTWPCSMLHAVCQSHLYCSCLSCIAHRLRGTIPLPIQGSVTCSTRSLIIALKTQFFLRLLHRVQLRIAPFILSMFSSIFCCKLVQCSATHSCCVLAPVRLTLVCFLRDFECVQFFPDCLVLIRLFPFSCFSSRVARAQRYV
jgi:hypothetical protein